VGLVELSKRIKFSLSGKPSGYELRKINLLYERKAIRKKQWSPETKYYLKDENYKINPKD
jgi:hypothetical protein